jgi:hypothetical protein
MSNSLKLGKEIRNSALFRMVLRLAPHKFLRHYIYPTLIRDKSHPYDMKQFFESWYGSAAAGEFSDGITLRPGYDPVLVRYHYNTTENTILDFFTAHGKPKEGLRLLDIGSGAGHWIDFYRSVFRVSQATAVDISGPCVESLQAKYQGDEAVRVMQADIAQPETDLDGEYDLINAIGVMFHIVDDELWKLAVANLSQRLARGGLMIVGGQFGWLTRNLQFHRTDTFETLDDLDAVQSDQLLVHKRIRSLRYWRRVAADAGMQFVAKRRTQQSRYLFTPENNILVLTRK